MDEVRNIPRGAMLPFAIGGFTDKDGFPTTIDRVLGLELSDPSVAALVTVSEDQLTGAIRRLGEDDSDVVQTFTVRIDGTRGEEVGEFDLIGQFTCTSAPATGGAITFGAAVPFIEPAPAPPPEG